MSNPRRLILEDPLDIDEARHASKVLAGQRRDAEKALDTLVTEAAQAEADYRKALAQAFVTAEGSSAAHREASARSSVSDKSYQRDVKQGLVKAQTERLRGLEGERSMLKSLIDWSSRINEETRERYGREAVAR